jgi:transcriptional regulator with XRE-family HTH domain
MIDVEKTLARLRAKMLARGLTQAETATKARISQSQVSRLLTGRFRRRSRCLDQLCRALGVAVVEASSDKQELTRMLHEILRRRPARSRAVLRALRAIHALVA